jgi:galactonate dehydratase
LTGLGLAPLAVSPTLAGAATRVRAEGEVVDALEVFRLPVNRRGDWIVVRLRTTGGLTGIGDASHGGDDATTVRYLRKILALLRGRSIFDVEQLRRASAEAMGPNPAPQAFAAASALEQCLWDLMGKALGVPTYDLFGGRLHERVRLYANINRSTDPRTPEGFARMARAAVDAGFGAVKLAPFDAMPLGLRDHAQVAAFSDAGVACAQAVRDAIGLERELLIDVHSRFGLADGLALAERLQPLRLFWLEEVTPAEPITDLATVNRMATMPTAGGESIHGVRGFYNYIRAAAVDIVMPDVKICGGMLEMKKIAAIAEAANLQVSPHGPASPIGNAAAAHVASTLSNFTILEHAFGEVPWRAELVTPAEHIDRGEMVLSTRAGLGIDLNAATLARRGTLV